MRLMSKNADAQHCTGTGGAILWATYSKDVNTVAAKLSGKK